MHVDVYDRERAHDRLINDNDLKELVDEVVAHPNLTSFVASVMVTYKSRDAIFKGAGSGRPLRDFAAPWYGKSANERDALKRMVRLFESLYSTWDPGNLRGMLLEQIVQRRMEVRYGGSRDLIENNAIFRLTNGANFDSAPDSIDVFAYDPDEERGECHNCKVSGKDFVDEEPFLERLRKEVVPRGFQLGLVVAQERGPAERALRKAGVAIGVAQLVTSEHWLRNLPLQP